MPRWWGSRNRVSVAVYDDLFPFPVSGFRLTEYDEILRMLPRSAVFSTLASLEWLGAADRRDDIVAQWRTQHPEWSDRLRIVNGPEELPSAEGYYTIFLNNAFDLAPVVEQRRSRFSFTLYPGGGLALADEYSASKLERVLRSPALDRVIVTQPVVREHLLTRWGFPEERIVYAFGVVVPPRPQLPLRPSSDRPALGFVAHKYHPQGLDKGLDIYVDAARLLAERGVRLQCHLVGPWERHDVADVDGVDWVLHGAVDSARLPELLREIDVCVFPTRAGQLGAGSFDGYPTGSAIEAGLAGCLVVTTNPLGQSTPLDAEGCLVEVRPDASEVAAAVSDLVAQGPAALDARRLQTMRVLTREYGLDRQMAPRLSALRRLSDAGQRR